MTVTVGSISAVLDCAMGPRPEWVGAVFTDMYPDDAVDLPTGCAATVLACDEDWQWIADHAAAVAAAVEQACTTVVGACAGEWVVGRGTVDGEAFLVCTAANAVGSVVAGVGNVVLVLRAAVAGISVDTAGTVSR
ncbi:MULTISPECIES: hypothetical protein [Williamsia]|uniref:Uncharacterized protein n=1 Tax=Williamsia limnetica TaxID=882452 RepID=A0A318REL0_WILLI|nr:MULTISPECIES: hypothetical protein [Williamsia]ORM38163.1 hypothetical protein BFL43_01025 [Williamsia sp. 1135]PYE12481.1 hypothetical protein DFR67_12265 [Williamsia limnetica]